MPNPSFEIRDSCPDNLSLIEEATGWKQLNASPDLFHKCATNYVSIPNNAAGHQYPYNINDSAYAGVGTILTNDTAHEIMGIKLTDTLIIGQKYYVSFLASAGDSTGMAFNFECFCNKIGAKFFTHSFPTSFYNGVLIDNTAQVYSDSIVLDT
ncbi:MAG: hypothetical protein ABI855_19410, partial [Bacteroidota bacterium]